MSLSHRIIKRSSNSEKLDPAQVHAYLVGGGIASLASAAYLIREGHVPGKNIHILEETTVVGGSMDGCGSAESGYVIRGGRMFDEEAYSCMYDLFSSIPSLAVAGISVKDEMLAFNQKIKTKSQARLIAKGAAKLDVSTMGFDHHDRHALIHLVMSSEHALGTRTIEDLFPAHFFTTNFWFMWCTTFAFQPWHSAVEFKRYMLRFMHEFPRIDTLAGVRRSALNQYDSMIVPITAWLKQQGVQFDLGIRVTDVDFTVEGDHRYATNIHCARGEQTDTIALGKSDLVFLTIGSMTAASSLGTMTEPARFAGGATPGNRSELAAGGSWALWEKLAPKQPDFGHPEVFAGDVDRSKFLSFTTTLRDPTFLRLVKEFSGNEPGTGALMTFKDSNWLMSIVVPYQPHFANQPDHVQVFWGYGLFPDAVGNFVAKKMTDCTGAELLTELIGHLGLKAEQQKILATSTCIPCMLPYITSQFMPRKAGDRPLVVPKGAGNFAFIGQYAEIPEDVVFTVEYSVRAAQIAVYTLLQLEKEVTPLYRGYLDPAVIASSVAAMHR